MVQGRRYQSLPLAERLAAGSVSVHVTSHYVGRSPVLYEKHVA